MGFAQLSGIVTSFKCGVPSREVCMFTPLINDCIFILNQGALGIISETGAYAYYLFLMAVGSLIAWRVG